MPDNHLRPSTSDEAEPVVSQALEKATTPEQKLRELFTLHAEARECASEALVKQQEAVDESGALIKEIKAPENYPQYVERLGTLLRSSAQYASEQLKAVNRQSDITHQIIELADLYPDQGLREKIRNWYHGRTLEDPYAELGIKPDASPREIREAFRRLVLKYHPDQNNGGTPEMTQSYIRIVIAYEQLI